MQINKIDNVQNQTFQGSKLRLVTDVINYNRDGSSLVNFRNVGKCVKEYANPNAKKLYKQAQKTDNPFEKLRLFEEMGEYDLKPLNLFERLKVSLKKQAQKLTLYLEKAKLYFDAIRNKKH